MRIGSGGGSVSIGARWDAGSGAPTQGYNAEMSSSGEVLLLRASDFAVLGSYQISGYAANTWVTLMLRASGSSLSVDVDGVTRITASDGTFTSGQAGVWSYQPGSARAHSFDDFAIVQLSGSLGSGKVLAKPAAQGGGPSTTRSYYFFNGARVAMRQCAGTCSGSNVGVVTWLHGDPLGSAMLATNASGQPLPGSETRYSPFGAVRAGGGGLPNDRRFNGNRADISGLLDFSARFMNPLLGRFVSADTIVPGSTNPQALNRYSVMLNNPIRYTDPSGHCASDQSQGDDWCRPEALRHENRQLGALHTRDFAIGLRGEVYAGHLGSAVGLGQIVDFAWREVRNNIDDLMWVLSNVLLGVDPDYVTPASRPFNDLLNAIGVPAYSPFDNPRWVKTPFLPDTDWWSGFQDGSGGQVVHLFMYVLSSFYSGFTVAGIGNALHDPPSWSDIPCIRGFCGDGRSDNDWALGVAGNYYGDWLRRASSESTSLTVSPGSVLTEMLVKGKANVTDQNGVHSIGFPLAFP
jgi:RHS repeat-associated protein